MNSTALTTGHTRHATQRRGFTLIELLVVIAVTAVLFALLIIPLVSALRYTQQAQIVTAAQDAARVTKERLTRELNSAAFVFDGTSHPFKVVPPATTSPGDDRYTNFLDLQILDKTGTPVIAHAYSAKLDFVLPKLNDTGTTDPTTGEPIAYRNTNGSAVIGNPSYIFPLAAGTTMIRYFVGLKDPTKPYNNTREGHTINVNGADKADDNTYILYRAQFQPYTTTTANGKTTVSANTALFAARPKLDANGNQVKDANGNVIQIPEIDDPDFFRYVGNNDINWLDDTHTTYALTTLANQDMVSHNKRVDLWRQIAKPIIPGPNVDLLLLPHNTDNTLNYDTGTGVCTATGCPGVAHSGVARDPVTSNQAVAGTFYPIVNTSVTFRPATVSGDASPGTTGDYNSQGVTTTDQNGFTYIPTVFTATSQSWSLPYHVSLYPSNFDATKTNGQQIYYDTDLSAVTDTGNTPPLVTTGDVLEYRHDTQANTTTLVYNVTQGFAVTSPTATTYAYGGTNSVPMAINPDSGTINFAVPSLPKGPTDRFTRQWPYLALVDTPTNPATPAARRAGGVDVNGLLDLTRPVSNPTPALTDSPLTGTDPINTTTATGIKNAHIAPGSVRVYGPDTKPGASNGSLVPYTEVNLNSAGSSGIVDEDQYAVDYANSTIQFQADLYNYLVTNTQASVNVVYDYQANMTLGDPSKSFSFASTTVADNTYQPMQVKVDYQTRDLIDVSIGVRIYDITSNRAQVIPAETKIKIGNSNR